MSARNLVRSLRDSGALPNKPAAPDWRSGVMFFGAALGVGAIVYLGLAFGLPALMQATARKPPPVTYAKVESAPVMIVASADSKPFNRTDELACIRYGEAAKKRADAKMKQDMDMSALMTFNLSSSRLGGLSAQLVCEAQTRPMRLCDPAERAKFVERTQPYLKEVAMILGVMGGAMNAPAFSMLHKQHDGAMIAKGLANQGLEQVATEHRKVATAFRDLAVRGLLAEADFASRLMGAPEAIRTIFAELPAAESVCPSV
jgi:hypothetical protein